MQKTDCHLTLGVQSLYKHLVERHRYPNIKKLKPPNPPQITMVSSRAREYITRFSTKGAQKKTILKKIVEYRDECKGLYRAAESKNPMNYRAAESKREYLHDMIKRIECLAEARDYLQYEINKKAPAKANNIYSAVAFVPEKETKHAKKPVKKSESDDEYDADEHFWRCWGRT